MIRPAVRRVAALVIPFAAFVSTPAVRANNDFCAGAVPIVDGLTGFDNTLATTDGPIHSPAECNIGPDGTQAENDIWFIYDAAVSGVLMVTTCEQLGGTADFNTDLAVYDGTDCSNLSLSLINCNDDDCCRPCGRSRNGYRSTLRVLVSPGNSYLIRVGGSRSQERGTGTVNLILTIP